MIRPVVAWWKTWPFMAKFMCLVIPFDVLFFMFGRWLGS